MWFWIGLLGTVVCLYLCGRYSLAATLSDWEFVLGPAAARALRRLEQQVRLDALMLEDAHAGVGHALQRRRWDEAARLAELAYSVVEEAVPDRLTRLKVMGVCCRMASAMIPPAPLRPRDFRLGRLATWAGLGAWIDQYSL